MSSIGTFFCYICLLFFGSRFTIAQLYGTAIIGQACERDYNCIDHAFCRAQLTCLCDSNYLPNPEATICIPTVGLICADNTGCALMSNAACRQNVCACQDGFTVDISNSSNCFARPVAENDLCQRNDECIDNLDRALCINDHCQCLTSHHFVVATGKCVRDVGMLEACTSDHQCHIPDLANSTAVLQCRDGSCQCREGVSSKHCNGASSNSAAMITSILFSFFVIFRSS